MLIHNDELIRFCPYTAIVVMPPLEAHYATFAKIVFIESGSCQIDFYNLKGVKQNTTILNEGDCFIAHSHLPYKFSNIKKGCYSHRDIYLSDEMLRSCCEYLNPNNVDKLMNCVCPRIFHLSTPSLIYFSERCSTLLGDEKNERKDLIHKSIVLDLLTHYMSFGGEKIARPAWINKLIRNLDNEEFLLQSIEEMIGTTNYSHGYVNREFKKYMNCSLKHFVNMRKLELSAIMLATSDVTLNDVVMRLGFATTSSFITQFRDKFGITPNKFKKIQGAYISNDPYTKWNVEENK